MFPGIFMDRFSLIPDCADLAFREHFLEPLDFGIRQRSLGRFVALWSVRRRKRLPHGSGASWCGGPGFLYFDGDPNGTPQHLENGRFESRLLQICDVHFGRRDD
jgi:hypothetical protein